MILELSQLAWSSGNFDLKVDARAEGTVIGLFGPSGSGKTSLLDLIAGLRRPAAGAIRLDGTTLTDLAAGVDLPARKRGIGYVPQDLALFPHLTTRRNVLYGVIGKPIEHPTLTLQHVMQVLELKPLQQRAITTLSGGEQRRVALARALMSRPRLLLLDEPLSGLDDALKDKTLDLLKRVREEFNVPMIYVSHAPEEVTALCDRLIVLEAGRVLRAGTPAELFEEAVEPRLKLRPVTP